MLPSVPVMPGAAFTRRKVYVLVVIPPLPSSAVIVMLCWVLMARAVHCVCVMVKVISVFFGALLIVLSTAVLSFSVMFTASLSASLT
ncbi:hypothetical protein Pmgp_03830 [Pelotomaculum propionicicum]|uniref:Uncharacterized protein n=1 Tax=Pelotomaculum propionicicum TaxID=258475 RepID=A0A4Y7R8M8_9FIRM|nr:hypothetical protein Pmgp_03830 [Pelotomaculum propionicicum]